MSKDKTQQFLVGDEVFHKASEEPARGIVTAVGWVFVDFGPELGSDWYDPATLSDTPIKRWKE